MLQRSLCTQTRALVGELLIDGEAFFSAEGGVEEQGPRFTSDLWERQQVGEPKKTTAAAEALNQPAGLTRGQAEKHKNKH